MWKAASLSVAWVIIRFRVWLIATRPRSAGEPVIIRTASLA